MGDFSLIDEIPSTANSLGYSLDSYQSYLNNSPITLDEVHKKTKKYALKPKFDERFLQHQEEIQQTLDRHKFPKQFTAEYLKNMNSSHYYFCMEKSQKLSYVQKEALKQCMMLIRPEIGQKKEKSGSKSRHGSTRLSTLIKNQIEHILEQNNFPEMFSYVKLKRMSIGYYRYFMELSQKLTEEQKEVLKQCVMLIHSEWFQNDTLVESSSTTIQITTEPLSEMDKDRIDAEFDNSSSSDFHIPTLEDVLKSTFCSEPILSESLMSTNSSSNESDQTYYAKVDEKLCKAGIQESAMFIKTLDRESFNVYKKRKDYTNEQKKLISSVRKNAQKHERAMGTLIGQQYSIPRAPKIYRKHSKYNGKSTEDLSNSMDIHLEDLDLVLKQAGVASKAKDIMEMSNEDFRAFKISCGLTGEQWKVVSAVRYRIRKRVYKRKVRESILSQASIHSNKAMTERLSQAGIEESVEFIRSMPSQVFAEYLNFKGFSEEQKNVLLSVRNEQDDEKEGVQSGEKEPSRNGQQRIHFSSPLKQLLGHFCPTSSFSKEAIGAEHVVIENEPKSELDEMLEAETSTRRENTSSLTPKNPSPTSIFAMPYNSKVDGPMPNFDSTQLAVHRSNLSQPVIPKNDSSHPEAMGFDPTRVKIKKLANGNKLFVKDSLTYPGHSYSFRLKSSETPENSDHIEVFECEKCVEIASNYSSQQLKDYTLNKLKTLKVSHGRIIEGDFDSPEHICVPLELIQKRYVMK